MIVLTVPTVQIKQIKQIEEASIKVCRNPAHLPQVRQLISEFILNEKEMKVEEIVEHWWNKQLFLQIKL